jgi:hypothetical protein
VCIAVDYLKDEAFKHPMNVVEQVVDQCDLLAQYPCCNGCPQRKKCDSRYNQRIGAIYHSKNRRKLMANGIKDPPVVPATYYRKVGKTDKSDWLTCHSSYLTIDKTDFSGMLSMPTNDEQDDEEQL